MIDLLTIDSAKQAFEVAIILGVGLGSCIGSIFTYLICKSRNVWQTKEASGSS